MFLKIVASAERFLRDQAGVTLVEYGVGIGLAVLIGATVLIPTLANDIGNAMGNAGAQMP